MNRSPGKKSGIAGLLGKVVVLWAWTRPWRRDSRGNGKNPSSPVVRDLPELSSFVSLTLLVVAALVFVGWGLLIYSTVGVKWPPSWYFQNIEDLPGSGIYSTGVGTRFGVEPNRLKEPPAVPQHVMGRKKESR